jgi:hypothetical protein
MVDPDTLYKNDDAAKILGMSATTLPTWISRKRHGLPYVRVGRSIRYRGRDLLDFIESHRVSEDGDAAASGGV